jgi:CHAP domain
MLAHMRPAATMAGCGWRGLHRLRRAAALPLVAAGVLLGAAGIFLAPAAAQAATASAGLTPGEGTGAGWCMVYGTGGARGLFSYDNVWACGPDDTKTVTPFDSNGTASFQCVELSERFLWAVDGLAPVFGSDVDGADLVALYHSAHPSIAVGSPGPSSLPQPGDVMSFSEGGDIDTSAGHTAVVVSAPNSAGNFTIMSQNWENTAGEETAHIDMTGAHDGHVQLAGSSFWTAAPFLELKSAPPSATSQKSAPPSATSQLVFDDYLGYVNSIQVEGINQNGQTVDACFTTPKTLNLIPNWWWAEGTSIWGYTSDNCTSGQVGSEAYTLTETPTSPPYHCQEDVSPYRDWNPGSNWENCAVNPPPNGVWHGNATGSFVRSM